nr:MAG TPA: hypothetical protein [Caudoviricetes sp.]
MINTNKINQVLEKLDDYLTSVNLVLERRLDNTVFYRHFSVTVDGVDLTRALYKPRINIVLKKIEPNDTELCFMIIITLGECQTNKPYMFYIQFSLPIEDEPKEILNNLKVNFRLNFGVSTYSSFTKAYIQHVLDVISGFIGSSNIVWVCALGFTVEQYYQDYGFNKLGIRLIPLSSLTYGGLIHPIIQVDIFNPYYNVTTGGEPLFLTSSSTEFKHVYTYSNIYNAYTLGYNSLLTNI